MSQDLKEKVRNICETYKLLNQGEKVLVACSGGPDSMTLLHILKEIAKTLSLTLGVFCLDHQLREESKQELTFVKEYCRQHRLDFYGVSKDVQAYAKTQKISLEMAGRNIRYEEMRRLVLEEGFQKIALGHHKKDQAETVLQRLVKGTGLRGLRGMQIQEGNLIRPLLHIGKEEILHYAEMNALDYMVDSSNLEPIYERNYLRLQVFPLLKKINPDIEDALCRMADIADVEESYLESQEKHFFSQALLSEDEKSLLFDRRTFQQMPLSMRRRVLRKAGNKFLGDDRSFSFMQLKNIEKILYAQGEKKIMLRGMQVCAQYDKIKFELLKEQVNEQPCEFHVVWESFEGDIDSYNFKREIIAIPVEWKEDVLIRHRSDGDRIAIVNKEGQCIGHKKLKDYLIDKKIPRSKRNELWWLFFKGVAMGEVRKDKKVIFGPKTTNHWLIGSVEEEH